MKTITYNARLFAAEKVLIEVRAGLSAGEVVAYARQVADAPRGRDLVIETLIDGESYQQFLSRVHPGSTGGGFLFGVRQISNPDGLIDKIESFMDRHAEIASAPRCI